MDALEMAADDAKVRGVLGRYSILANGLTSTRDEGDARR